MANPTVASFEERVASLEGGIGAVATACGLAAQFVTFAALTGAGDHIVASWQPLRRHDHPAGRDAAAVRRGDHLRAPTDPADYAAAITDKTKLIFVEMIANPSGEIADLEGLAEVAHAHHLPLIVDSTVATPYLNRPIEWGADVVIHSATKFLGGHGTTLGGVVVESGRFHWANERFPLFDQPVAHYGGLNWHGNFGEYAFLTRLRAEQLRDIGPMLAPHSAWQLAQGVETLPFRMQAHVENAQTVAEWLDADARIEFVDYAGLPSHPHHERAAKYLPKGPGSVFSFGVKGTAPRPVGRSGSASSRA